MSRQEKLLARIRQNPKNVRFEEIDNLLLRLGFDKRQKGSHAFYSFRGKYPITIPFRKPFILPVYVKNVLKIIDELELEDKD